MTTEEILKLPAGDELDRQIAEKVFGCTVEDSAGRMYCRCQYATHGDSEWSGLLHSYSTDIWHAWEVVEKMKPLNVRITSDHADSSAIFFDEYGWEGEVMLLGRFTTGAQAQSVPHAICLAAIKAKDAQNHPTTQPKG